MLPTYEKQYLPLCRSREGDGSVFDDGDLYAVGPLHADEALIGVGVGFKGADLHAFFDQPPAQLRQIVGGDGQILGRQLVRAVGAADFNLGSAQLKEKIRQTFVNWEVFE